MGNGGIQSYEVQVYHNKRWIAHARYESHERGVAVREAKTLDQERQNVPVRVIMEDLSQDTGRHSEILIYRNKVKTHAPPKNTNWADMAVSSDGRIGYMVDDYDNFFDPYDEYEKPKAKVTFPMFFAIVGMIFIIGVACGVVAAGTLALLMRAFEVSLADDMRKTLLVGMFIVICLIAFSSSLNYYRAKFDLNPFSKKKRKAQPVKQSKVSKEMKKAAAEIDQIPIKIVPTEQIETDIPQEASEKTARNASKETSEDASEDEFYFIDESVLELTPSEPEEAFSPEAQQQKMFLINFLGTSLSALKGPDANIKTLNRFGLYLFMTGAVIRMAEDHELSDSETHEILCRILEMLGAKTEQAERFVMDYEKYLAIPRHAELFKYSGDIAKRFSDGDQSAPLYIRETMESWLNWKSDGEQDINPNLLCIMFTDMVGSTDLTTKHGDYAAQEVLKAHDMIVRTALANFDGTEIKHLGDGIMASFKNYDLAVQATIEIQKRVEGNNNSGPEFPLHVRIGLNVGEPIKKNNDLFGTSVQLAARLCDITESDCISVSQDLKDLFGEKPVYTFVELGPIILKGFEVPMQIYSIDWRAPLIEYPDEEEGEETPENQAGDDHTAPDMAVQKPEKEAPADPNFSAGFPSGAEKEQVLEQSPTPPVEEDPKTV